MPDVDKRAKRLAKKLGLRLMKSRRHLGSFDNQGEYMLVDVSANCVIAGSHFDLTAEEAVEHCLALQD